jgi:hypothetical protein
VFEIDIRLPEDAVLQTVPDQVEELCIAEGMIPAMRGTLATYPGCTHWHFKRSGQPGTLEVTWWPKSRRLWFKVAEGRDGPWIKPAIARIKAAFEGKA